MTRRQISLNQDWLFHYGEIDRPAIMAKKSYALGGLTAPLPNEDGDIVPLSAGGHHFLKLIAQGNERLGLRNLAGTKLINSLDDSWTRIDLPDDWKRREPYTNDPNNLMSGSKADGVAYYRKIFTLPNDASEKQEYYLHFAGIMRSADIWLNGAYLGHNNSGYTAIDLDITPLVKLPGEGVNVVLVRTDTTTGAEGWWYEGAGIYKNVSLEMVDRLHIDRDSLFVQTEKLTNDTAKLKVQFTIKNDQKKLVDVKPQFTLGEEKIALPQVTISAYDSRTIEKEFTIDKPQSWSPENPFLYQAKLVVNKDEVVKQVGIRIVGYDTDGFILNGHHYELRGVCEHQDFLGIGVALNQDIVDYKIKTMKKMGVNALRSSHHFASVELLDACDRLGVILIDENRLLEATPWRLTDLEKMVKKSRQHPSIAFWSIANEEVVGNTEYAKRSVSRITELIRRLDPGTILVSAELLNPDGIVNDDYLQYFDILGVNYPEAGVMGNGAELIHEAHPQLPMMSTENASYFSTRGIYKDDGDQLQCNNFGSMYSMVLPGKRQPGDPGVGGTAHPETVMDYKAGHPYMGGVFLWTGFDYYGEPSPFSWPGISSQFGICDLGGLPKDYYYYYQAHWSKEPVLHLMPTWNKAGLEIDKDGYTKVRVFSNLDEVELILNEQSLGKQAVTNFENNWRVKYEPGKLEVKGYRNGQLVATDLQQTSGQLVNVKVEPRYQGQTTTILEITAVDQADNYVPDAVANLEITPKKGTVLGIGNGNPADTSDYSISNVHLFAGKAMAIVKNNPQGLGEINVQIVE